MNHGALQRDLRTKPGFGAVGILLVVASAFAGNAARAQNVETGKHIAQTWCSGCHNVAAEGAKTGSDATPSFSAIAQEQSTTSISLVAFLSTPHPHMPNYVLSRTEMRDVSAYILSLRKAH
jgi:mono/diheme cytochrome c family protein